MPRSIVGIRALAVERGSIRYPVGAETSSHVNGSFAFPTVTGTMRSDAICIARATVGRIVGIGRALDGFLGVVVDGSWSRVNSELDAGRPGNPFGSSCCVSAGMFSKTWRPSTISLCGVLGVSEQHCASEHYESCQRC